MAQGVYRNSLFTDADSKLGVAEGALHAAFGHGLDGLFGIGCFVAASWEDKTGMAMSEPVLAQPMEGRLGQRDVAVLGALAAVDMDHHALAVDVADLQVQRFL